MNAALVARPRRRVGRAARSAAHRTRRRRARGSRCVDRARSRRSCRCRSRSRPSTGSRCAAATRRACTSSCATTRSRSTTPTVRSAIDARAADPLFGSGSVRVVDGGALSFVYKAAAEIGELGDNTAVLRAAILADDLLARALSADTAEVVVLGHTRWASVGIISEANAHPLNQEETDRVDGPYVVGALNGDVDNYADLTALEGLHAPAEITTDAKVIPALVARRLEAGLPLADAFRTTVAELEGSLAIGAQAADAPGTLLLSLRGSGQALYVGLADDAFVVASEPYGLVEEAAQYLRLDGETPGRSRPRRGDTRPGRGPRHRARGHHRGDHPHELRRHRAPGVGRRAPDRGDHDARHRPRLVPALPLEGDLRGARVVPQDAAREDRRTRRAPARRARCRHARSRRCSSGCAPATSAGSSPSVRAPRRSRGRASPRCSPRSSGSRLRADAEAATELSGFGVSDDMSDTVVVAISQSGTTTDTNRTVDLVRGARRARDRGRQPAEQRSRRQVRRRALHVGRPRPRDGGAVHQGVLRAGGGGLPARTRDRDRARHDLARSVRTRSWSGCARCPTRCTTCSRSARRSR